MIKMHLTRNEKRVLKLLLENAKISDSTLASILKISSQAIGKIRRKLERTVIDSYTLNLNYEKVGVHTFAIGLAQITSDGHEHNPIEIEQKLLNETHILQVHRIPSGKTNYIILYGFRDVNEMDHFFHSERKKKELHAFIENHELHTFSHSSILKNNPIRLFHKMIDNENYRPEGFKEDKIFKSWF